MNTLIKTSLAVTALTALAACTTYGDPTAYADLSCEALKQQYAPANQPRITADALTDHSNFRKPETNKLQYLNPNLAANQEAKRQSDLRAAYRANGC